MAEHDKHYHKDGYSPETDKCGRRDTEKDRDSVESHNPPFTADMLDKRFGTRTRPFSKEFLEEEKSRFATYSFMEGWKAFSEEPTEEEMRKTISRVGNVLSDLEKRFTCKIKVDKTM